MAPIFRIVKAHATWRVEVRDYSAIDGWTCVGRFARWGDARQFIENKGGVLEGEEEPK